ncbi:hypothetical protein AYI69_g6858 [Smittium culicis]|uniref:Uncharacterized protein n=1 Tax=Smittium culicis TaxID=133412 RepID=A0A1R1XW07_9FUNG|nr:hypothetical protein AYI69_g6858 [Smittium culicis]
MVSGYFKNFSKNFYKNTFHGGSPRSSKLKVGDVEKQGLVFNCVEDKMISFKKLGSDQNDIRLLLKHTFKR